MTEIPWIRLGIPADERDKVTPDAPLKVRMAVARGLLPLAPHLLVPMAYVLLGDPDRAVVDAARTTLMELPAKTITGVITQRTHPKLLEFFAEFRREEQSLMEVIFRVREANDRTVLLITESAGPDLVEMICRNQERLLITPTIYLTLKENPNVKPADLDRVAAFLRMNEMLPADDALAAPALRVSPEVSAADPQARKARALEAEIEAALLGLPSPATNPEVLKKLDMFDLEDLPKQDPAAEGLGGFVFNFNEATSFSFNLTEEIAEGQHLGDEERLNIVQQLNEMTIGEKIKLAHKGNAEVRKLLVRDRNKLVAGAVIKSGRMNDSEILTVASNRNLEGEVIRELTRLKEAMRKYPVKVALVNNPKCPVSVAVGLVNQLQKRDLQALSRNKNVSGAVHQLAVRKVRALRKSGS